MLISDAGGSAGVHVDPLDFEPPAPPEPDPAAGEPDEWRPPGGVAPAAPGAGPAPPPQGDPPATQTDAAYRAAESAQTAADRLAASGGAPGYVVDGAAERADRAWAGAVAAAELELESRVAANTAPPAVLGADAPEFHAGAMAGRYPDDPGFRAFVQGVAALVEIDAAIDPAAALDALKRATADLPAEIVDRVVAPDARTAAVLDAAAAAVGEVYAATNGDSEMQPLLRAQATTAALRSATEGLPAQLAAGVLAQALPAIAQSADALREFATYPPAEGPTFAIVADLSAAGELASGAPAGDAVLEAIAAALVAEPDVPVQLPRAFAAAIGDGAGVRLALEVARQQAAAGRPELAEGVVSLGIEPGIELLDERLDEALDAMSARNGALLHVQGLAAIAADDAAAQAALANFRQSNAFDEAAYVRDLAAIAAAGGDLGRATLDLATRASASVTGLPGWTPLMATLDAALAEPGRAALVTASPGSIDASAALVTDLARGQPLDTSLFTLQAGRVPRYVLFTTQGMLGAYVKTVVGAAALELNGAHPAAAAATLQRLGGIAPLVGVPPARLAGALQATGGILRELRANELEVARLRELFRATSSFETRLLYTRMLDDAHGARERLLQAGAREIRGVAGVSPATPVGSVLRGALTALFLVNDHATLQNLGPDAGTAAYARFLQSAGWTAKHGTDFLSAYSPQVQKLTATTVWREGSLSFMRGFNAIADTIAADELLANADPRDDLLGQLYAANAVAGAVWTSGSLLSDGLAVRALAALAGRAVVTETAAAGLAGVGGALSLAGGAALLALSFAVYFEARKLEVTRFETPASRQFLADLGLDADAAAALADQNDWSGATAVPVLAAARDRLGIAPADFLGWLNALSPSQLEELARVAQGVHPAGGGLPALTSPDDHYAAGIDPNDVLTTDELFKANRPASLQGFANWLQARTTLERLHPVLPRRELFPPLPAPR